MNEAHSALTNVADDMAQFYDVHGKEAPLYKTGDNVWLNRQISPQANDEEAWSQMAQSILSWKGDFMECLQAQNYLVFWVSSSGLLSHLPEAFNPDTITKHIQKDIPTVIHDGVKEYKLNIF